MSADAPSRPQLVAEQASEHMHTVQKELVNTLTSHLNAAFDKQHAFIQTHVRDLDELDAQLRRAQQQLAAVARRLETDADSLVARFLQTAACHHQAEQHDASPTTPSRPQTRSLRDNTRLSNVANGAS
ncbi:unnamed protein product [Agarophyton chilense]